MMASLSSFTLVAQLVKTKSSPIISVGDEGTLADVLEMPFRGAHVAEAYVYRSYEPLHTITSNTAVDELMFQVHQNIQRPNSVAGGHYVSYPAHLSQLIVGSAYANFYENCLPQIQAKFSHTTTNWPSDLNFARVIRNAYSHGGKIHFDNPNAAAVSWKDLTYSPDNNGQPIHPDIFVVEIIQLMQAIAYHVR